MALCLLCATLIHTNIMTQTNLSTICNAIAVLKYVQHAGVNKLGYTIFTNQLQNQFLLHSRNILSVVRNMGFAVGISV